METKGFFQFEIIIHVLVIHLNTYVMGLRLLFILNSFGGEVDFRRQILASLDVRISRL